ncbi:MFS transporter [Paenibacillus sp. CN-4]|uniref:MFS transporter n=1 Tax=Paenibacillus nanchangensis TaxID=3348343 RepID=UPI00397B6EED
MRLQNPNTGGLLRNKGFTRVYAAYALAVFGDWFDALAIQVLAGYRWGVSPIMLAMIPVALALPGVLLGSWAGVTADRIDKLKLMRICDLLTALLTVCILAAPNMAALLPILALRSAVSSFAMPAHQSLTRRLVREDQLMQASSLNGFVNQGSKIFGPLLGGAALLVLSPMWCIAVNACARLLSYLLLRLAGRPGGVSREASAPARSGNDAAQPAEPAAKMWSEGWRFVRSSRTLMNTLLFCFTATVAIQIVDFQFTSLFRELDPERSYLLGWMVSASGVGAVTMMAVMSKWNRGSNYGGKFGIGYLLLGVSLAGLGWLPSGAPTVSVLLLGGLLGLGNGLLSVTFTYALQKETPPAMTGRVFGIQHTVLSTVMVIAPLAGGASVQSLGASRIFIGIGAAVAVLGAAGVLLRRRLWPETGQGQGQADTGQLERDAGIRQPDFVQDNPETLRPKAAGETLS